MGHRHHHRSYGHYRANRRARERNAAMYRDEQARRARWEIEGKPPLTAGTLASIIGCLFALFASPAAPVLLVVLVPWAGVTALVMVRRRRVRRERAATRQAAVDAGTARWDERRQAMQAGPPYQARFRLQGEEITCEHEHRTEQAAGECARTLARRISRERGLEPPTFREV